MFVFQKFLRSRITLLRSIGPTGIFVNKVLKPCFKHPGGQTVTHFTLKASFTQPFYLIGPTEDFRARSALSLSKPIARRSVVTGNFFTVNVGIHYIVDVEVNLDPASFALKLRGRCKVWCHWRGGFNKNTPRNGGCKDNNTLGAIYNKREPLGSRRIVPQIHVPHDGLKIFMFRVCTIKVQFRL